MKIEKIRIISDEYVKKNAKEFYNLVPSVKNISTDTKEYSKKLDLEFEKEKRKIVSFTYILETPPFKKILILTIDSDGKIIKVSKSK